MAELSQFLELFKVQPGYKYIQVTTEVDETTTALYELLTNNKAEMRIAYYTEEEMPNLSEDYPLATIQHIKNFNLPYRALPRDNDIVIYKDIFSKHNKQSLLLKTAYKTLANTADIIIMEKKGVLDIQEMIELFEKFEYRAPNYIDILDGYDIFMAKKLHMWGNGL
ncbi:hypothetical protein [Sulfurimonas sp.]|uniref:hypothetical protein n=1 Tax=Sulfurimonas sp. TaxID=2022749 RepID=UPI003565B962